MSVGIGHDALLFLRYLVTYNFILSKTGYGFKRYWRGEARIHGPVTEL